MDKAVIIIIVAVILFSGIFWAWQSGVFAGPVVPTPLPAGIVLFYGQGCPHCADVEKFISQNNIDSKLKITRLEVWYNKSNQMLLGQVALKCGITGDSVGVPFLYDGNGKCYIGETDVPSFLKTAAGIK
jgi:hypothetical protein